MRMDTVAAACGFATWFVVTASCQHPDRSFDRLRDLDPTGISIPEWRFFAPEPGRHDFHVVYRTETAAGEQDPWRSASEYSERSWKDFIWFPGRRESKGLFDLCGALRTHVIAGDSEITQATSYRLIRDYVEKIVRKENAGEELPPGFQFAIVLATGYDEEHDPEYLLVSPFIPMGS
jgi:hypothetical protein